MNGFYITDGLITGFARFSPRYIGVERVHLNGRGRYVSFTGHGEINDRLVIYPAW